MTEQPDYAGAVKRVKDSIVEIERFAASFGEHPELVASSIAGAADLRLLLALIEKYEEALKQARIEGLVVTDSPRLTRALAASALVRGEERGS
jgi:hypothetical protein